jgi:hypothetical protein
MLGFYEAFNHSNCAMGKSTGECFEVVGRAGKLDVPGKYLATSIDDLNMSLAGRAGGRTADNEVNVYVNERIVEQARIGDGSILIVRGARVRITGIHRGGHDNLMLACTTAGLPASAPKL